MKPTGMLVIITLTTVILTSCQPSAREDDSSEIAKEHNDLVITDKDDEKDADFIVNAVAANLSEINLAKLALKKSTDSDVKKIAGMLEADHTKVLSSLPILIVDPERAPAHQRMVIVKWKKTNTATCTQLLIDGQNRYLKPHNPSYSITLINEADPEIEFLGVIREVFMKY